MKLWLILASELFSRTDALWRTCADRTAWMSLIRFRCQRGRDPHIANHWTFAGLASLWWNVSVVNGTDKSLGEGGVSDECTPALSLPSLSLSRGTRSVNDGALDVIALRLLYHILEKLLTAEWKRGVRHQDLHLIKRKARDFVKREWRRGGVCRSTPCIL